MGLFYYENNSEGNFKKRKYALNIQKRPFGDTIEIRE
jgi:hypothetical protein